MRKFYVKETNQPPLFAGFWPKLCIRQQSWPGENLICWWKMKRLHARELWNKCYLVIRLKVRIVAIKTNHEFQILKQNWCQTSHWKQSVCCRQKKKCCHQQSNLSSLRLWHITRSELYSIRECLQNWVTADYYCKFLKNIFVPKNIQQQARIVHSLCPVFA